MDGRQSEGMLMSGTVREAVQRAHRLAKFLKGYSNSSPASEYVKACLDITESQVLVSAKLVYVCVCVCALMGIADNPPRPPPVSMRLQCVRKYG